MKLLIKQKIFALSDSYNVYDEEGEVKYTVRADIIAFSHKLHVYDRFGTEVGLVHEHVFQLTPTFDIEIGGQQYGTIRKKIISVTPKYDISYHGWNVRGNLLAWKYDVYDQDRVIMHIDKRFFRWNDTYVIDIEDPANELMGLMLVIAIDAANCDAKRNS